MGPREFLKGRVVLHPGDCLDVLASMEPDSVDVVICDPPYHFNTIVERFGADDAAPAQVPEGGTGVFKRASSGFMGKTWDGGDIAFDPATWAAVMRVLKPGGHLAAFAAPKCVHRMGMAIELAGFEMRDRIVNFYDPEPRLRAFLDSLTRQQADALMQLEGGLGPLGELFWAFGSGFPKSHNVSRAIDRMAGADSEKVRVPASEVRNRKATGGGRDGLGGATGPWIEVALKNGFHEKDDDFPVTPDAKKWDGWGTALKPAYEPILLARKPIKAGSVAAQVLETGTGAVHVDAARVGDEGGYRYEGPSSDRKTVNTYGSGLSPCNLGPVDGLGRHPANITHDGCLRDEAERFFYHAKAEAADRVGSKHPTVKPVALIQWLVRLLTPPGGVVLDPFAGTGTTGEAAYREGFSAVLIEREQEYWGDISRRMGLVKSSTRARRRADRANRQQPPLADDGVIKDMLAGMGS
ncbi:MAG: site-specific DNA-methyltransferase [Pseudomonadota bacterium]